MIVMFARCGRSRTGRPAYCFWLVGWLVAWIVHCFELDILDILDSGE